MTLQQSNRCGNGREHTRLLPTLIFAHDLNVSLSAITYSLHDRLERVHVPV